MDPLICLGEISPRYMGRALRAIPVMKKTNLNDALATLHISPKEEIKQRSTTGLTPTLTVLNMQQHLRNCRELLGHGHGRFPDIGNLCIRNGQH